MLPVLFGRALSSEAYAWVIQLTHKVSVGYPVSFWRLWRPVHGSTIQPTQRKYGNYGTV